MQQCQQFLFKIRPQFISSRDSDHKYIETYFSEKRSFHTKHPYQMNSQNQSLSFIFLLQLNSAVMTKNTPIQLNLEPALKQILQLSVEQIKPKLRTKSLLAELQELMIDYNTIEQLANTIINVLNYGIAHPYLGNISKQLQKDIWEEDAYINLQVSLQKHEQKIRNYIRNEQQMKLYCEELEAKVKELQEAKHEVVVSTKKTILELKRDNQQLIQKVKNMQYSHDQKVENAHHLHLTPNKVIAIDSSSYMENTNNKEQHHFTDKSNKADSRSSSVNKEGGNIRATLLGSNSLQKHQNESKSKLKRDGSQNKHNYHKIDAYRGKIEQVNNIMKGIQVSKSMRGSVSSLRVRKQGD